MVILSHTRSHGHTVTHTHTHKGIGARQSGASGARVAGPHGREEEEEEEQEEVLMAGMGSEAGAGGAWGGGCSSHPGAGGARLHGEGGLSKAFAVVRRKEHLILGSFDGLSEQLPRLHRGDLLKEEEPAVGIDKGHVDIGAPVHIVVLEC